MRERCNEVRAVMLLESGQRVELPALGAFDQGWRTHTRELEERVNKLTILQIDAR